MRLQTYFFVFLVVLSIILTSFFVLAQKNVEDSTNIIISDTEIKNLNTIPDISITDSSKKLLLKTEANRLRSFQNLDIKEIVRYKDLGSAVVLYVTLDGGKDVKWITSKDRYNSLIR